MSVIHNRRDQSASFQEFKMHAHLQKNSKCVQTIAVHIHLITRFLSFSISLCVVTKSSWTVRSEASSIPASHDQPLMATQKFIQ